MVCAAAPCNAALEAIAAGASQPGWLSFSLTAWATDQCLIIWSTARGRRSSTVPRWHTRAGLQR
eukprot:1782278-Alexandrium_andersonii.AAC.1